MTSSRWIAAILLLTQTARAQDAVIRVETNDPAAHVFADSTWLGTAVRSPFSIGARVRKVRVVPSAIGTWGVPSLSFDLHAMPGDTLDLEARFPYVYRLESTPRAEVLLDGSSGRTLLGDTPLLYRAEEHPAGVFLVEREGYVPAVIQPGNDLWNLHSVKLEPAGADGAGREGIVVEEAHGRRRWIDYTAVGVAIVAGVVAVHYKLKADRLYDEYTDTGDPTLRPPIDRYDRYSAAALGTMQVGIGVFALRLAFR